MERPASRVRYQLCMTTSGDSSVREAGEWIEEFGLSKVFLGSDAFMNDLSVGLGMIVYVDIPDEYKRAILGLNMAKLLDRVGALPTGLKHWLN